MTILTWRNISYDKEQFAPEKLTVIVKCEAANIYTNLEKFNGDQYNCTNSPDTIYADEAMS